MDDAPDNPRLEKLRALVAKHGGHRELARIFPELNADYIGQLLNGTRGFGERAARKMAGQIGEPSSYFDTPVDIDRSQELAGIMSPLSADQRAQVIGFAKALAAQKLGFARTEKDLEGTSSGLVNTVSQRDAELALDRIANEDRLYQNAEYHSDLATEHAKKMDASRKAGRKKKPADDETGTGE